MARRKVTRFHTPVQPQNQQRFIDHQQSQGIYLRLSRLAAALDLLADEPPDDDQQLQALHDFMAATTHRISADFSLVLFNTYINGPGETTIPEPGAGASK